MSAALDTPCRIRRLAPADLPEILAIERAAYDYPWSEDIFRDCLRVGYRGFAAVDAHDRLMGYGLLSIAVTDAHVLNLCVGSPHRRKRVASRILRSMLEHARAQGADTLMLEVRVSNQDALKLYQNTGFERVGRRKRYYPASDGREDALLLSRPI